MSAVHSRDSTHQHMSCQYQLSTADPVFLQDVNELWVCHVLGAAIPIVAGPEHESNLPLNATTPIVAGSEH
jgi:hypothetical protein